MTPFDDLEAIRTDYAPMSRHTSFKVGGTVRYLLEPREWGELGLVYQRCLDSGLRVRILGGGCNTLVADGLHQWAVISTRRLARLHIDGTRIEAGAGLGLPQLVATAERCGLGGLETLAGIPGSVGGAVAMNAGGRDGYIARCLVSAVVAQDGEAPRRLPASELGLAYRRSGLSDGRFFLLSATFELDAAPPADLRKRHRALLAKKRASQPLDAPSAGCVFKNPPGTSAGVLIDQAGLKNSRVGGAVVSDLHANFILNDDNATATDILQLVARVRQTVFHTHGVWLELEIEVWLHDDTDEWNWQLGMDPIANRKSEIGNQIGVS